MLFHDSSIYKMCFMKQKIKKVLKRLQKINENQENIKFMVR